MSKMKLQSIAVVTMILCMATAIQALYITVECIGTKCGGSNDLNLDYCYRVKYFDEGGEKGQMQCPPPDYTIYSFQVGTDCLELDHYTNWHGLGTYAIVTEPELEELEPDNGFTPHGSYSTPTGQCPAVVRWSFDYVGLGEYYFGFDNIHGPHDVGGYVAGTTESWDEDWNEPMGAGLGPLHGPVPEPMTIALLGIGAVGMLHRRRRL